MLSSLFQGHQGGVWGKSLKSSGFELITRFFPTELSGVEGRVVL